jgi:hypothetical protein
VVIAKQKTGNDYGDAQNLLLEVIVCFLLILFRDTAFAVSPICLITAEAFLRFICFNPIN